MKLRNFVLMVLLLCVPILMGANGCGQTATPVSATGVKAAKATIQKGADGLTIEQRNVKQRLELDNNPGSIKHLYLFSAFNGQCIFYSTVRGKVTSSGKRLTPVTVTPQSAGTTLDYTGFSVKIGDQVHYTSEVLQDDGTYGNSIPYLYWWDANGKYMQIYVTGGSMLMISDQPIAVRQTTVNLSIKTDKAPDLRPEKDE